MTIWCSLTFLILLYKVPLILKYVSFYLVGLARFCIWKLRCQVKYDHCVYDGGSCFQLFKTLLRLRIRTDCLRYNATPDLFHATWACGEVLCTRHVDGSLNF